MTQFGIAYLKPLVNYLISKGGLDMIHFSNSILNPQHPKYIVKSTLS